MGLGLVIAFLFSVITRNGMFVTTLLDLLDAKRKTHKEEINTLERIHSAEQKEKADRLKAHQEKLEEIKRHFKLQGRELDKKKEAELKRIVDEGYNDSNKLARDLAEAFGIKNG